MIIYSVTPSANVAKIKKDEQSEGEQKMKKSLALHASSPLKLRCDTILPFLLAHPRLISQEVIPHDRGPAPR